MNSWNHKLFFILVVFTKEKYFSSGFYFIYFIYLFIFSILVVHIYKDLYTILNNQNLENVPEKISG